MFNDIFKYNKLIGVTIILTFLLVPTVAAVAQNNTVGGSQKSCNQSAEQLTQQIRGYFDEGGQDAQDFYEVYKKFSPWENVITQQNDIEKTYAKVLKQKNGEWEVHVQYKNLNDDSSWVEIYPKSDITAPPDEYILTRNELSLWYDLKVNQNLDQAETWYRGIIEDMSLVSKLADSCNINLTLSVILSDTFANTAYSSSGGSGQSTNDGGSSGGGSSGGSGQTTGGGSGGFGSQDNSGQTTGGGSSGGGSSGGSGQSTNDGGSGNGTIGGSGQTQGGGSTDGANVSQSEMSVDSAGWSVSLNDAQNGQNQPYFDISFDGNFNLEGDLDSVVLMAGNSPNVDNMSEINSFSSTSALDSTFQIQPNGKLALNEGEEYYAGVYVIKNDGSIESLSMTKLGTYTTDTSAYEASSANWQTEYNYSNENHTFDISVEADVPNAPSNSPGLEIRFGPYDKTSGANLVPVELSNQLTDTLTKNITNTYTSVSNYQTYNVQEGKKYYAALYEGTRVVSHVLVGTTKAPSIQDNTDTNGNENSDDTNSPNSPAPEGPSGDNDTDDNSGVDPSVLEGGLVPCVGGSACGWPQLIGLVENLINFIFILIVPVSSVMFVYAGSLLMFRSTNPESRGKAKEVFLHVLLGVVIILSAWLLVKTILVGLGVDSGSDYLLLDLNS